jgi:hypothetical protein
MTTTPVRGRGKRLDEATRKALIADLQSKQYKGRELAEMHGVSLPTVQNIKLGLGLVKPRKTKLVDTDVPVFDNQ